MKPSPLSPDLQPLLPSAPVKPANSLSRPATSPVFKPPALPVMRIEVSAQPFSTPRLVKRAARASEENMAPHKLTAFIFAALLSLHAWFAPSARAAGATYYVATWGADSNPGTIDSPWGTWQKGFETAEAGDTVYFRGGTWYPTSYALWNAVTYIDPKNYGGTQHGPYGHDGTAENPIRFFAYPPDYAAGNFPILDCSHVDTTGHKYNNGMEIYRAEYLHFKGLTLRNVYQTQINDPQDPNAKVASGIGPYLCSNLTFENMTVNNIGGRGFSVSSTVGYLGITSDTTRWINCDVYNCADMLSPVPGNAADGWKCDGEPGAFFYFEGCRAWNNSDDGIDVSGAAIAVIKNCWSFKQGFAGAMDGNGFKFGGNRGVGTYIDGTGNVVLGTLLPGPRRYVTNCIAAANFGTGFFDLEYAPYYRNDSRIYNNFSYANDSGFAGSRNNDFPLALSRYRNNIAYKNADNRMNLLGFYWDYDCEYNSWREVDGNGAPFNVERIPLTDADFVSLDVSQLSAPRKPDGSLPDITFAHLTQGSALIDAGIDVGLPYGGTAPDIGAFEYGDVGHPGSGFETAPAFTTQPLSQSVSPGATVTFTAAASGTPTPNFQWRKNGVNIASPNSSSYTIASAAAGDAGSYSVVATNPSGSATSTAATLTVSAPVSGNSNRLVNISTRSLVGTDDKVQIAGFVIGGTSPKSVLIRASGPALNVSFGLSGYLADPLIELHHSATGDTIASNDNWAASLAPTFTAVGAFPWTTGSNDAALLTSLNPGAYTVIVKGKNNGTGVALVEVYDADVGTPTSKLINISTRSLVGSDDNVQIAGFVIGGSAPKKVVIRASGLALHTSFELSGNLADPLIELHEQATGNLLATADDWDAALAADFAGVGAFPWTAGSKDAALVTTLNPGAYTAMVKGKNNGTGVALIEVYEAN